MGDGAADNSPVSMDIINSARKKRVLIGMGVGSGAHTVQMPALGPDYRAILGSAASFDGSDAGIGTNIGLVPGFNVPI
ncbi:hypothetical protein GCM10023212_21650 [Luteolibacter yonseiensis]